MKLTASSLHVGIRYVVFNAAIIYHDAPSVQSIVRRCVSLNPSNDGQSYYSLQNHCYIHGVCLMHDTSFWVIAVKVLFNCLLICTIDMSLNGGPWATS